ncbi:MAG: hypothetical protein NVS1B11_34060 [Terriglobales bacterium]
MIFSPKLVRLMLASLISLLAFADDIPGKKIPYVTMSPAEVSTVARGKPSLVNLHFRVAPGFHVNSNMPSLEYLIATSLKLDAPTDIVVGKITYPTGQTASFPFAPDQKLSVYSGPFDLAVTIRPLASVIPGKYSFHGQLKYQACDNAACYPPRELPVEFEVKVVKGAGSGSRENPKQSPHIHS